MTVDYSEKRMIQVGNQRLAHYRVICDSCSLERWQAPRDIRQRKNKGNLCRGCASRVESKSPYADREGYVSIKGRAHLPVTCPECSKERLVYAHRVQDMGICKPCRDRQMGLNTKVGISDGLGKTCPGCGKYQAYSEYWKSGQAPDGYQSRCKSCQRITKRKYESVRIARKRGNGGSFTLKEWECLCAQYGYVCLCCGGRCDLQIDHIVPVSKNGSSNIDNIQPLCANCNVAKSNKTIDYRFNEMVSLEWF